MDLIRTKTDGLPYIFEGASQNTEEAFTNMDGNRVDEGAINRA